MSRIAVLGATSQLSSHFLPLALAAGHSLTCICRGGTERLLADKRTDPRVAAALRSGDDRCVAVEAADSANVGSTAALLRGHDVVFSSLSPPLAASEFDRQHTALIGGAIEAIEAAEVPRFIVVGGAGILRSGSGNTGSDVEDSQEAQEKLILNGPASLLAQVLFPQYRRFNTAHATNFSKLRTSTIPEWTMLCPGFLLPDAPQPRDTPPSDPQLFIDYNDTLLGMGALAATYREAAQVSSWALDGRWNGRRVGFATRRRYWPQMIRGVGTCMLPLWHLR